jgi:hypothetical protein
MRPSNPLKRNDSLIVKELPDETLVYDTKLDKAHCLNLTAALVWKNCDGKKSVAELREVLAAKAGNEVPEEMVWLALDQLKSFKLLSDVPARPTQFNDMSRRDLVRRIGFAALTLPVIISIAAPPAHAQASLLAPGACCNSPGQCTSNSCNQSPVCVGLPSTKACA